MAEWVVSPFLRADLAGPRTRPRRALVLDASTGHRHELSRGLGEALVRLRARPAELPAWAARHPRHLRSCAERRLLLPAEEAFRTHRLRFAEIEVNTHCNYRCVYCPNHDRPKARSSMPMPLYRLLLERLQAYGTIEQLKLHHYSEPLLDRHLLERVQLAVDRSFGVKLHTNGSLLDEDTIRALARTGRTMVVVNLPTLDPERYRRVTGGSRRLDRVLEALELLKRHRVPTRVSANIPRAVQPGELGRLNSRLGLLVGPIGADETTTRAGHLRIPGYADAVRHRGRLTGCAPVMDTVSVNVRGEAFLCCMDFDQRHVYGDLARQSLREVADGPRAEQLRRWCFGGEAPPRDFLCVRCSWNRPLVDPAPS